MRALTLTHVFSRSEADPSAPFLLDWARALRAAGHEVVVVAPHDAGLPARGRVGGVPVRWVRYGPARLEVLAYRGEMHRLALRGSGPVTLAALFGGAAAVLRRLARTGRPDVVHVHWWLPGMVIARLARLEVPLVAHLHGTDVGLVEARPRLAAAARWALAAAARIEVASSDLADRLHRATGLAADAVNPMPLPPDRLRPLAADERAPAGGPVRVLALGRLIPEKGFADLVAAAAGAVEPLRVRILGEGPERGRLVALARHHGVALDLPGAVPPSALRAEYAAAHLVAQPSHREGFGLVAAEASALGVPVVATDSGGVRDVLGPDARLVQPGDVAGLAAALAAAAADLAAARAAAATRAAHVRALLDPSAAAARTADGWRAATSVSPRTAPRNEKPAQGWPGPGRMSAGAATRVPSPRPRPGMR